MISRPQDGHTSVPDFVAPLLSNDTFASLRRMAATARWPNKTLTARMLDLCEAERAVHVAQVAGDADAVSAAEWHRCGARAELTDDQFRPSPERERGFAGAAEGLAAAGEYPGGACEPPP